MALPSRSRSRAQVQSTASSTSPLASAASTSTPVARRLLLVAPEPFWRPVGDALAASSVHVTPHDRPAATTDRRDPYGVRTTARLAAASPLRPDGLLLVAPTRRSPRRLVPGPLVDGLPVGVVQADTPTDLDPWLAATTATATAAAVDTTTNGRSPGRAVMAMGVNRFLDVGSAVLSRLADADTDPPLDWRADRVSRSGLAERLATGPTLALYVGHGRAHGWSGYQTFRWGDAAAEPQRRPTGTVVALACDTLTRHRMVVPFGVRLVATGRACTYLGVAGSLPTTAAETLARVVGDCLVTDAPTTVGALVQAVDDRLAGTDETAARRAFSAFRLVGSPLAPV